MLRYACVTFAILFGFLVAGSSGEEEIHEFMAATAKACIKEFGVSLDDFNKAKIDKDLSRVDPCFIGCMIKGKELIDDKGMFDPKKADEISEKIFKNADDIARAKKTTEICVSVNEQAVSDGNKGCERAVLLLQCLFDNKSHMM